MSKINRGKQFEKQIQRAFLSISNCSVDRILDPMAGYAGVKTICDFNIYKYPLKYYIECKSCYGDRFPLSNITKNQWNGLLEKSKIDGIVAGYMIWFIDHSVTIFVSADFLNAHFKSGAKSISVKDMLNWGKHQSASFMFIPGQKRRILFDYDMEPFLTKCEAEFTHNVIITKDIAGNTITEEC